MIQRLEPVITEMEREGQSIVIVAHQAVLRILYGYLTARPQVGGVGVKEVVVVVVVVCRRSQGLGGWVRRVRRVVGGEGGGKLHGWGVCQG
jgi:broad specificity phosphatase PhoE